MTRHERKVFEAALTSGLKNGGTKEEILSRVLKDMQTKLSKNSMINVLAEMTSMSEEEATHFSLRARRRLQVQEVIA